jgi:hypothetical protein
MKNSTEKPAVLGPVERQVRPRVWLVRRHDAPNYWIPFLHEPVDALKDHEREVVRLCWPDEEPAQRIDCNAFVTRMRALKRNGKSVVTIAQVFSILDDCGILV